MQGVLQVSRRIARIHLATKKNIQHLRWFDPTIVGAKPNVKGGHKCDSINNGYAIIGAWPNRLTKENSVYVFKKDASKNTNVQL